MKKRLLAFYLLIFISTCAAPPPHRNDKKEHEESKDHNAQEPGGLEGLGIEYERYLREVIDVLESDQEFKKKLETAEETDIRSGKIAHELEYVDHNVRSKLDEVKRAELERLRHYAQKEFELTNGIDVEHMKIQPPEHLDHDNPHTFEINDLKKLIHKVTNDLSEADKKRREEFKEYEMQKEFEKDEHLKHLEGAEKEAFEKQLKDNETKHKQHEPLHHPGSKAQLEEVWEKQDHMKDQEFDPKVFFQLHDLDGNGYWDQNEVKVLFIKELDKMYQAGAPEDDMRERAEELERMREHVFKEADKNGDQLISYTEFINQTKQPEFEKDPQWETIDQQQPVYTHEEYMEFERRRQQEIQHMIQQGLIPPQPQYNVPPGYHPQQQFHQAGQHVPQPHHQQQAPYQAQHPGQHQFEQHHQPPHPGQQQQYQPPHPGQLQHQPPHPGQQQQYQPPHPSQQQQYQPPHPGQQQQYQPPHPGQQQQYQPPHPGQQLNQPPHPGKQQYQPHYPGQLQNLPHEFDPNTYVPPFDQNAIHPSLGNANAGNNPSVQNAHPYDTNAINPPNSHPSQGNPPNSNAHPTAGQLPQQGSNPNQPSQPNYNQASQHVNANQPSGSQHENVNAAPVVASAPQHGAGPNVPQPSNNNGPADHNAHPNSIGDSQKKV